MNDLEIKHRLMAMREYLGVRAKPEDPAFENEVKFACQEKITSLVGDRAFIQGEELIGHVATSLGVRFEEVRSQTDIAALEKKYLDKKEFGFGQLSLELEDPDVDALLLKRMHAEDQDPDRWVAVLNLQESEWRCYWNKSHEVSHRLAEPPQREMPFYRHRASEKNRVEHIVDLVAADIAFYKPAFSPVVEANISGQLDWNTIASIRSEFAPTSSIMATANAVIHHWPMPVFLLSARMAGRKRNPGKDRALRVAVKGFNEAARNADIYIIENMRVPVSSPIYHAFNTGMVIEEFEQLNNWSTSDGTCLQSQKVFVSARPYSDGVLGLMTLL